MAQQRRRVDRGSGIVLEFDESVFQLAGTASGRRRGRPPSGRHRGPRKLSTDEESVGDDLVASLTSDEVQLIDTFELEANTSASRRGPKAKGVTLEATVAPTESAVMLVEQDGVLSWHFPDEVTTASPTHRRRGPTERQLSFTITLSPARTDSDRKRRGVIGDYIFGKAKAWVIRIAARVAVGGALAWLERHVNTGMVSITSPDPETWERTHLSFRAEPPTEPSPPKRILLLVHGTFSSTVGSYGALGAYEWGRQFLEGAINRYDQVIGFDHRTLSVDPLSNAMDLLNHIGGMNQPVHLDIISFSRGGLVVRSLLEHLLPASDLPITSGRHVMVGVPNGGTSLAEPKNWKSFLDLYTNLASAAFKVLKLVPQFTMAAKVLDEAVSGLTSLATYMAEHAVDGGAVPGLAAMQPRGSFVRELNLPQSAPSPLSGYFTITSNFEARLGENGLPEARELPKRFVKLLLDKAVDQLMRGDNDLVVNTASMTDVGSDLAHHIKDRLDFGTNPHVFHTIYFTRPEVSNALRRWLLDPADSPPVRIDTRFITFEAERPWSELRRAITEAVAPPSYVIVNRITGEHYAIALEDILKPPRRIRRPDVTVAEMMDLHEDDRSTSVIPGAVIDINPYPSSAPTAHRTIVNEGNRPLGIISEDTEPIPNLRLSSLGVPAADLSAGSISPNIRRSIGEDRLARVTPPEPAQPQPAPPPQSPLPREPRPPRVPISDEPQDDAGAEPTSGHMDSPETAVACPNCGSIMVRHGSAYACLSCGFTLETAGAEAAGPESLPSDAEDQEGTFPESDAPQVTTCHFYAEFPAEVRKGRTETLIVTCSREIMELLVAHGAVTGSGTVQLDRDITIDIVPRSNFEVVDERSTSFPPPAPGESIDRYFSLKATDLGVGEIWVIVRQGQAPLARLILTSQVVKAADATPTPGMSRAEAQPAEHVYRQMNVLRIFDRSDRNSTRFEYELDLPGTAFDRFKSETFRADRETYVNDIYQEIEQRWTGSNEDIQQFELELREYGASLCRELFPEKLQRLLWKHRNALDSIVVISTEPFVPWELVHLRNPDARGLPNESHFLAEKGLVRWLRGTPMAKHVRLRPERCFHVIPAYPHQDDVLVQADAERTFMEDTVGCNALPAHLEDVRRILKGPGAADLLHFACHGHAASNVSQGLLQLQGIVRGNEVSDEYLQASTVRESAILTGDNEERPIVMLNACEAGRRGFTLTGNGGFTDAFLEAGAAVFVGAHWSICDQPARTFGEAFYTALLAGEPLSQAAIAARNAARGAGEGSWLAYAVYGYPFLTVTREDGHG